MKWSPVSYTHLIKISELAKITNTSIPLISKQEKIEQAKGIVNDYVKEGMPELDYILN